MKGLKTPNIEKHISNRYLLCLWRAKWFVLIFWSLVVTCFFTWSDTHGWAKGSLVMSLIYASLQLVYGLYEAWGRDTDT